MNRTVSADAKVMTNTDDDIVIVEGTRSLENPYVITRIPLTVAVEIARQTEALVQSISHDYDDVIDAAHAALGDETNRVTPGE